MTPLLIEAQRLKQFSTINGNLDNKLIEPTIIMVQDINLQQILGTDLYEEICTQVDNSNLSVDNKYILDTFIEPYLTHMVTSQGLLDWHIKISNKDVAKLTADSSISVDMTEMEALSKRYQGKAEFYATRLTKYLCGNSSTYPLYLGGNVEEWKLRPIRENYTSGIFTKKRRVDPRDQFAGWRNHRRRY
jgi:hypothetical protein